MLKVVRYNSPLLTNLLQSNHLHSPVVKSFRATNVSRSIQNSHSSSRVKTWFSSIGERTATTSAVTVKPAVQIAKEKMAEVKPKVVFVLGGPGAGKGTQCSKIVDRFNFVHLSAGDLLRDERSREGSQYGSLIEDYIRNGKIVPVEITCSLIESAMLKSGKQKFLIDGFPRNQDNLDGWTRQMGDKADLQFVLFFSCDEDVCVERCLNRGHGGSGRSDDNMESIKKRINTYTNDSMPIIKHFQELGQVKQIDASQDVDNVFKRIEKIFTEAGFQ